MNVVVESKEDVQAKEACWIATARILIVLGFAEIAPMFFHESPSLAYCVGLLVGVFVQFFVLPKATRKRTLILLLIVLIAGAIRLAIGGKAI